MRSRGLHLLRSFLDEAADRTEPELAESAIAAAAWLGEWVQQSACPPPFSRAASTELAARICGARDGSGAGTESCTVRGEILETNET